MPFMVGRAPIRRTIKYLDNGQILFRDNVRIFSMNYNTHGDHHEGARQFLFWHMPQLQYKNPNVQCISFKNMTPSPFIKLYRDDGDPVLIDIDSRSKHEIHDYLKSFVAVCKTPEELALEAKAMQKIDNPASFGHGCDRHCICEILGQVPCPCLVPLPFHMRGKYKYKK